jgi:hypothetical protein
MSANIQHMSNFFFEILTSTTADISVISIHQLNKKSLEFSYLLLNCVHYFAGRRSVLCSGMQGTQNNIRYEGLKWDLYTPLHLYKHIIYCWNPLNMQKYKTDIYIFIMIQRHELISFMYFIYILGLDAESIVK